MMVKNFASRWSHAGEKRQRSQLSQSIPHTVNSVGETSLRAEVLRPAAGCQRILPTHKSNTCEDLP